MTTNRAVSVGTLVGSLRERSFSRRVAHALVERAPDGFDFRWIDIGDLPLYTQDRDDDPLAEWTRFRDEVAACEALLFVTPEYDRSIPGALKNATDIGSRPDDVNVFDAKPAAIVSVTPCSGGGMTANHALRQDFVYLNMRVMQQPEAYIETVEDVVHEDGTVAPDVDELLTGFTVAFAEWIDLVSAPPADSFAAFLQERERISGEYISGNPDPLAAILTDADPATFFPPLGARGGGGGGCGGVADLRSIHVRPRQLRPVRDPRVGIERATGVVVGRAARHGRDGRVGRSRVDAAAHDRGLSLRVGLAPRTPSRRP